MPKKPPLIRRTALTGKWSCIVKYRTLKNGIIVATESYDVTSQIHYILAAYTKSGNLRRFKRA